jgi:phosphate-selective porin OprO/OprP
MNQTVLRFLLAGLLACALRAADLTVEERLNSLEQQVQHLANENADLKRELGWNAGRAPVLAHPVGKEARISLGGFLQAQGEFGRAADPRWAGVKDRFYFRRARVYVLGSFAEDFDFKAELELGANSLGAGTGLSARANEVYVGWHKYPVAVVRFGQLKSAFGAEQLASDTKLLAIERSQSSDRLTDSRQTGLTVGGELFEHKLGYLVMLANGNGVNASANDNGKFQQSARVYGVPVATKENRLVLGTGVLRADDAGISKPGFGFTGNLFTGHHRAWGVDGQWTHGRFDLFGEYLHSTFTPAGGAKFEAEGWQATAAYYLVPARVQALVRHEQFDPNTTLGGNTTRSWTLGLNYLIKGEDLRLMVDYIHGVVPGTATDGGRVLTRMQVLF